MDDSELDAKTLIPAIEAVVTGLAAHTWAEVWLEPYGWTTWEATPAVNPAFTPNLGQEMEEIETVAEEVQLDSATAHQLSSMLGREIHAERGELTTRPLLIVGTVLLLAATVWAAARMIAAARAQLRASPIGRVARRYIAVGTRAGIPQPQATGWLAWADRFSARLPEAAAPLGEFVRLFVRVAYAGYQPTAAEVAAASRGASTVRHRWLRSRLRSLWSGRQARAAVA